MQTSAISPATTGSATSGKGEANMGTEAFLTLLITQLRSQNPLEPMDPNEFVAQLAQFNSLSQLIEIRQILEHTEPPDTTGTGSDAATTPSTPPPSNAGIGTARLGG